MSGNKLTKWMQKKAYFLFIINLITRSKKIYGTGRSLNICGTLHMLVFYILLHIKTTEQSAYMNKMRLVDAK